MKNYTPEEFEIQANNSLAEIRKAIADLDKERSIKNITDQERETIELSIIALRQSERILIEKMRKNVLKELTAETETLKELAALIRSRVTKIGKAPKWLDKVESIIKTTVTLLAIVVKW